ncbi:N-acetylglucosamine-6-phosphate deacetylase [Maritalea myrionectae]|uniref:N-acetylglucosamine-6-phosphate deacetylase n=1 Tax=Maritalea myrionectae TaxID=454601 RepID=UPI000404503B|nr:N-acetylglucosamine-6-phosphate deacetylase [Maritalea myrionectae]
MAILLKNATVFDGERFLENQSVEIANGKISRLMSAAETQSIADEGQIIDLQGQILAPGFVDVQVNGGGGVMFNDQRTVEGLTEIVRGHRQFGSTTLMPTLITDSFDVMREAADAISAAINANVPGIRGVHFEGPYLSLKRRGVHAPEFLRDVDDEAVGLFTRGDLGEVIVTVAPECVPNEFVATLSEKGVHVCAGHSAATYEQIGEALKVGLRGFTHLFNAMPPLANREPSVVGAGLDDAESWCGLIVDGYHLHFASARIVVRAKPQGKIMLVTDAMATVGAEEKHFNLYGDTIHAVDGRCALDDGTLAGSDLDMMRAVELTHKELGLELGEALRMASLYPAQFLRLDDKIGRIAPDYDADLVAFDKDSMKVTQTWIKGEGEVH